MPSPLRFSLRHSLYGACKLRPRLPYRCLERKLARGLNIFQLGFLFQIEGRVLLTDIPGKRTFFDFDDNEENLDVIDVYVSVCHLRWGEYPMFQSGNEIVARAS